MSRLPYLSSEQITEIRLYFPLPHRVARVDDTRGVSDIIYAIKHGL